MASDRPLVELNFKIDTASWARQLGGFAKDVLPYAANYALILADSGLRRF